MIGKTINNYIIERKLGEGGMGNVYFARHNRVDRLVAIKVLHQNLFTNENIRNRFKNEANALIKLGHPNIVKIYDYVEQDNFACLVMEYIEGYTLDDYISKVSGPLVTEKAIHIICNILDAVQYAHDNNILHRDIKPGNIMVSKDGRVVRIMDFGIAKFMDVENFKNTFANTQLGTPFYMSPEQVKGSPYTRLSDIYSLGVTLFEMVTGKCPYQAITNLFELQNKIVNEPLPPTAIYYPDVSPHLQTAIKKATEKKPAHRFGSCMEFKTFLLSEDVSALEPDKTQLGVIKTKTSTPKTLKTISTEKIKPAGRTATVNISQDNKISAPNLLAAYPMKERKKKTWVFVLLIFLFLFISGFLILLNKNSDRDSDGVADNEDNCPELAGLVLLKGCPDKDGDGIADVDDKCPDEAGIVTLLGCPETEPLLPLPETTVGTPLPPDTTVRTPPPSDRDGDGIADNDDKCPDLFGFIRFRGCPENDPTVSFRLKASDILRDALSESITYNGDVFTNNKRNGQNIKPYLPSQEEIKSWSLESENPVNVDITITGGVILKYQFIYKKTEERLIYITYLPFN